MTRTEPVRSAPAGPAASVAANMTFDPELLKQQLRDMPDPGSQTAVSRSLWQEKPRKTFVEVRSSQVSVSMWLDSWAQKIERVGTSAYPRDSYGNKLHGRLRLSVEVNLDGSILEARVVRSSGNAELDEAALHILKLAAPFPRLPPDLVDDSGKPASVLVITRTWLFGRDNLLGSD